MSSRRALGLASTGPERRFLERGTARRHDLVRIWPIQETR